MTIAPIRHFFVGYILHNGMHCLLLEVCCLLYVLLVGGVEDLIAEDLHVKIQAQKLLDKYHTCM